MLYSAQFSKTPKRQNNPTIDPHLMLTHLQGIRKFLFGMKFIKGECYITIYTCDVYICNSVRVSKRNIKNKLFTISI